MQAAEPGIVTLPERFETFYRREFRSRSHVALQIVDGG